ncbi:DUF1048 domain-containing protein [Microbacterium gorillae]|uniref:DUF1048 domain-containing protein n=1 Tax=Microbacterium gorillae TaxID=1231063 RepID=UPI00058DC75F|nr:DUF1048 domain-containing protein [Microbacterium gorillae]
MVAKWIEALTGPLEQKKQYREGVARLAALPEPYRQTAEAFQRYFLVQSGIVDGDILVRMLADWADLWETAAADGATVRSVVGEDPVTFAEEFARAYDARVWIDKERARLRKAVAEAEREQGS